MPNLYAFFLFMIITPLCMILLYNRIKSTPKSLEQDLKNKSLCWASKKGQLDIVKDCVENGADIHVDNEYPLKKAIEKGHLDVVKFLVENGANIHIENNYPLSLATEFNHSSIIKYLISINEKNDLTQSKINKTKTGQCHYCNCSLLPNTTSCNNCGGPIQQLNSFLSPIKNVFSQTNNTIEPLMIESRSQTKASDIVQSVQKRPKRKAVKS